MKAQVIQLPKVEDPRGNLSIIEQREQIPFDIHRVSWIYDIPGGETRGSHAYRQTQEFIVALSGCFDVCLHDGRQATTFTLNRSYMGLYIPAGTWRTMLNFSTNSVALVLSSTDYDEADYIWHFDEFLSWKNEEE